VFRVRRLKKKKESKRKGEESMQLRREGQGGGEKTKRGEKKRRVYLDGKGRKGGRLIYCAQEKRGKNSGKKEKLTTTPKEGDEKKKGTKKGPLFPSLELEEKKGGRGLEMLGILGEGKFRLSFSC